jgi:hypothetical protein
MSVHPGGGEIGAVAVRATMTAIKISPGTTLPGWATVRVFDGAVELDHPCSAGVAACGDDVKAAPTATEAVHASLARVQTRLRVGRLPRMVLRAVGGVGSNAVSRDRAWPPRQVLPRDHRDALLGRIPRRRIEDCRERGPFHPRRGT